MLACSKCWQRHVSSDLGLNEYQCNTHRMFEIEQTLLLKYTHSKMPLLDDLLLHTGSKAHQLLTGLQASTANHTCVLDLANLVIQIDSL